MLITKKLPTIIADRAAGKAIINAFKTNALFQVENISQDEAKQRYIESG